MLVLSRQKDESIIIGDDVEITIVDVRGDKVRLGIEAPQSIPPPVTPELLATMQFVTGNMVSAP